MSSHHASQRFCLRWNNHQSNLLSVFDQLLHDESFVDVTLAVEGQFLRAHKMVLSACSPYFQALFVGHPDKHPIVILKDVPYADMRSLLDFMYRGEVSVDQDRLTAFLKVAESLRIKGLTEVNEERCDLPSIASSLLSSAGFTQQTTQQQQQQQTQQQQQQSQPPLLHRIHVPTKRSIHSNSLASNPLLGSALTAPKRKRGRPRRLSGSDEHRNQSHKSSTDSEDQRHDEDSDAPSSGVHGPPDLLEVNMPEFHSPPSRLSQSDTSPPPSEDGNPVLAIEDSDRKVKPEFEEPTPGTSQQESGGGGQSPKSSSQDSESKLPSDLPKLRLVPKSELMAIKRNDAHNDHHFLIGHNIHEDGELDKDNNNDSSNCLEMSGESSDKALALVPSESSGNCFSEPPLPRPPIRRRVRRRAASSNDPAEQLTEMSVRGLNLFRYASVSDGVYKCTECAKSDILKTFKNKYSFQRHAFLYHEGCHRKVFPCPVCAKQFSRPDKMKNHMKTVHECYVPKDILFPNVPFFMQPPPSAHVSPELKFTQEMKFPSDEIITHH